MIIEDLRRQTLTSFLIALLVHAAVFIILMTTPAIRAPSITRLKITEITYLEDLKEKHIVIISERVKELKAKREEKEARRLAKFPSLERALPPIKEALREERPRLAEIKEKLETQQRRTLEELARGISLKEREYVEPKEFALLPPSISEVPGIEIAERPRLDEKALLLAETILPEEASLGFQLEESTRADKMVAGVIQITTRESFLKEALTEEAAPAEPVKPLTLKSRELETRYVGTRPLPSRKAEEEKEAMLGPGVSTQISGPIARRKILLSPAPPYPDWAQKWGVEARVRLRFVVLANGKVKDTIYVEETSGYSALDKLGIATLKEWLFEPLPEEIPWQEQWGIVTFVFRLK